MNWSEQGCEACRDGVLSGEWSPETVARLGGTCLPPKRVASNLKIHAYLHYCNSCGAWWEFGERYAKVISETKARRAFESYFARH